MRSRPAAIFRACLHSGGSTADAWVAQAGLCAGLFADRIDEDVLTHRYKQISDLIRKPPP